MADVSFPAAAAAYARGAAGAAEASRTAAAADAGGAGGSGFADLVVDSLGAARDAGRSAEADALRALRGEIGMTEVVASMTNAEVTLQTVVALRDRVIGAYNDIIRMPI